MGTLADRLSDDLKNAMRHGDAVRRDEIRGLLAALKAERLAKLTRTLQEQGLILRPDETVEAATELSPEQQARADRLRQEVDLTPEEEEAVLQQRVKQHRQSIEGFQKGQREDLVAVEQAQLAVLEPYLPRQIGAEEIDQVVRAAIDESGAKGPRDMARVMPLLSQRLRGRADMKLVSSRVQALLAQTGAA